jgi:hypothetical protein
MKSGILTGIYLVLFISVTISCSCAKAQHAEIDCLQLVSQEVDSLLRRNNATLADFDGWVRLKFNTSGKVTDCVIERSKTSTSQLNELVRDYFINQAPRCLWATYGGAWPDYPSDEVVICVCMKNLPR